MPIEVTRNATEVLRAGPTIAELRQQARFAATAWSVAPFSKFCRPRLRQAFGILTYHRVAPTRPGMSRSPLTVTPEKLRSQLEGLLARGYAPWPLRKTLEYRALGHPIPRNAFVVVFDDGYANVARYAVPTLARLKIPATVFVATAYLDQLAPFPFDDWRFAGHEAMRDAWQPLSSNQVRRMLDTGWVEIGSHTHTHQDFRGRSNEFREDVAASLEVLEQRFGIKRPPFALPFGACEPTWPELLERIQVSCCVTTCCQLVMPADSPYQWGRFGAEQYDSPLTLAAKLDGWYSYWQNAWRQTRARWQSSPRPEGAEHVAATVAATKPRPAL